MIRRSLLVRWGWTLSLLSFQVSDAAEPTARQALSLSPMQQDFEFDRPADALIDQCKMDAQKEGENRAWVVTGPEGTLLRRFADTNGDNKIDQWCYYRGGVEVYRDIDADFNEKADQYRWFNTGGTRWGLDTNEDGHIDEWKWISAEEVTAELMRAIRDQDADRFVTLLITKDELTALGLPAAQQEQIQAQAEAARAGFAEYAKGQTTITSASRWVDFSAPIPGVVTSSTNPDGVFVYENVIAMIDTEGKHGELSVGTLIRADQRWRLVGLPKSTDGGIFFRVAEQRAPGAAAGDENASIDPKLQELVQQLESLDQKLAKGGNPVALGRIHGERVGVLREMIGLTKDQDRDLWVMQLIDAVAASAQTAETGTDIAALEKLATEIDQLTQSKEAIGQAKFVYLTAAYSDSLQKPNANLASIQEKWVTDLKDFVGTFQGTRPAAEALLQLAISEEFAGNDTDAVKWYSDIVRDYPDTDMAVKAAGAARRLKIVGKPLELRGSNLAGKPFDLASLQGNLVLVHYWATWCEPCKQDMQQLKKLLTQYGRSKFTVVGINLDEQPKIAADYLQREKMAWMQLHEAGGLESNLAKQLGIFTVPVMLLVDEKGKVVNRTVTIAELEAELQKRLKTTSRK